MADETDDNSEHTNDGILSDHCIAMRNALSHCEALVEKIIVYKTKNQNKHDGGIPCRSSCSSTSRSQTTRTTALERNYNSILSDAQRAARTIPQHQMQSLEQFYIQHLSASSSSSSSLLESSKNTIDRIVPSDDDTATTILEFRKKYLHGNIPCLIEKFNSSPAWFGPVTDSWTTTTSTTAVSPPSVVTTTNMEHNNTLPVTINNTHRIINDKWFLDNVGNDTLVPIRYSANSNEPSPNDNNDNDNNNSALPTASPLDEDGRAVECETVERPLEEWIQFLRRRTNDNERNHNTNQQDSIQNMYLKDWHLISLLQDKEKGTEKNNTATTNATTITTTHSSSRYPPSPPSLSYTVPPHFQGDLLNGFLTKFTKGDYKFVYWGPTNSRTDLHSDVMNSFSWSYNVIGEKEWTFYPPPPSNQGHHENMSSTVSTIETSAVIVVTQKAGECMFVPSGWKHKVKNMCETISINHNWITTANMDRVWDCLTLELMAVDQELEAWSVVNDDDFYAKESMLRGCVGLDVTCFFFLSLTEYLGLLLHHHVLWVDHDDKEDLQATFWENCFDMVRLRDILYMLLSEENDVSTTTAVKDPTYRKSSSKEVGSVAERSNARIRLKKRLAAVLESENLASRAFDITTSMLDIFHIP